MNFYQELAQYPIFSIDEVLQYTTNIKTAYSIIYRLMKNGLVKKIRNNMYSPINPVTNDIVASKYQVACAITKSAYLSHLSALEFYGLTNQVFYEIFVSSIEKFNHFTYEQMTYHYILSKINEGIVESKHIQGIRVTDLERTVIECIHDVNKIGSIEELVNALEAISFLDEKKLITYLDAYQTQGLFQSTGFILSYYKKKLQLSDDFFVYCQSQIGKSTRYLVTGPSENDFDKTWNLVVPKGMFLKTDEGDDSLASV